MKKGMIFGFVFFIGYICSINYIVRNKIYYNYKSESEKEEIQLQSIDELEEIKEEQKEQNEEQSEEQSEEQIEEQIEEEGEEQNVKTKGNLKVLFEKKKYMIELDRELCIIKDKLEDIRNNLHNFN